MLKRKPGRQGLEVSAVGLGCMGMSWLYGKADDAESIRVLHHAFDIGVNFWDTAETYGPFRNEELIGRALKGKRREAVILATKFAWRFGPNNEQLGLDSSPAHIKWSIEGSLKRLGTDYIDLYYQHRLDPKTPIEDTMGALADLVKEGKVRYVGLSEVGPGTIRRAHAVHPLSAVQSEYSLWTRGIEEKVLPALRELGIGLVAYSPVGRGFLTGKLTNASQLDETDWRRNHPRFQAENMAHNSQLVDAVKRIAESHRVTAAQVALAWLLGKGSDIVPIPGTKRISYLDENAAAADVRLPESAWAEVRNLISSFEVAGARYPEAALKMLDTTE